MDRTPVLSDDDALTEALEAVPIPGTNVRGGLDPILGIVPVAGDAISAAISLYIILEAAPAGVSPSKLLLMIGLVGVDAVVGSIPIVGTVFDVSPHPVSDWM